MDHSTDAQPRGIDSLLAPGVLQRWPDIHPSKLTHTVVPREVHGLDGTCGPIVETYLKFVELKQRCLAEYRTSRGVDFDPYNVLNAEGHPDPQSGRDLFINQPEFDRLLKEFGIDPQHKTKLHIPWWIELAAAEGDAGCTISDEAVHVTLTQRLSLETQLVRQGVPLPIKSASVGTVVETNDDHIVLGLRGGHRFKNTYHISCGALKLTPGLLTKGGLAPDGRLFDPETIRADNPQSIWDVASKLELAQELGITSDMIRHDACTCLGRVFVTHPEAGPIYVFKVPTDISSTEVAEIFASNDDVDKGEHSLAVVIPRAELSNFIRTRYQGYIAEDCNHPRDVATNPLFHDGALALALYCSKSQSEAGRWLDQLKSAAS